jgi:hypothetical protein
MKTSVSRPMWTRNHALVTRESYFYTYDIASPSSVGLYTMACLQFHRTSLHTLLLLSHLVSNYCLSVDKSPGTNRGIRERIAILESLPSQAAMSNKQYRMKNKILIYFKKLLFIGPSKTATFDYSYYKFAGAAER